MSFFKWSLVLCSLILAQCPPTQSSPALPSEVLYSTPAEGGTQRVRGITNRYPSGEGAVGESDFILGGLFPVHAEDDVGEGCGRFRIQGGLDRMEAMLFAIDTINSNDTLLPNITLGYDIRDTCYLEHIGLDEAADLILTGHSLQTAAQIETCPAENENGNGTQSSTTGNNNSTGSVLPTIGLIGATASRVSIPIAGLSRLFFVPQVSYASTSAILNSRERYSYFYRTIPADTMEARAIIDLLVYFNWTYISTVFSRDSYGQSGTDDLEMFAEEHDICINLREGIEEDFTTQQYQELAQTLVESEANVIVLYASQQTARNLLEVVSNTSASQRFTWIATSAWAQSTSILRQFSSTVAGMFGTIPLFRSVEAFNDYYSHLTTENNIRNAWFSDFVNALETTNCTIDVASTACDTVVDDLDYELEYAIPLVIDSVYTFAHAIQNFLDENCDTPIVWDRNARKCNGQRRELSGPILLEYIKNVTFLSPSGNSIQFDENGSVEAVYEVLNYQAVMNEDGQSIDFNLVTIAVWNAIIALNDNETQPLRMLEGASPQFGLDDSNNLVDQSIPSECGQCNAGRYLRMIPSSCCGLCEPCLGSLYSNSAQAPNCSDCLSLGEYWGESPLIGNSGCMDIPKVFLRFSDPWSIITMITAILGLLFVVFVVVVYGKYWATPVVKSSSRENMVILVIGIVLSFITTLFYLSPPSIPICVFQRTLLWLCFSMIFSTLTMKTVRIARLFIFEKNSMSKLRFMETKYQVLFTIILIVIQMVIVFGSLVGKYPLVRRVIRLSRMDTNDLPEVVVTCEPDPLVALVVSVCYETGLLIIATVLGTLSFKYPANFNEARSISCAGFALLAVWIAFIPTYFATQEMQELQNAAIAFAVVLSGMAVLVCLFGPRVYILLFWKERNTLNYSRRPTENDLLPDVSVFQTSMETLEPSCSESEDGESPPVVRPKKHSVTFFNNNGHPVTKKHSPPPSPLVINAKKDSMTTARAEHNSEIELKHTDDISNEQNTEQLKVRSDATKDIEDEQNIEAKHMDDNTSGNNEQNAKLGDNHTEKDNTTTTGCHTEDQLSPLRGLDEDVTMQAGVVSRGGGDKDGEVIVITSGTSGPLDMHTRTTPDTDC